MPHEQSKKSATRLALLAGRHATRLGASAASRGFCYLHIAALRDASCTLFKTRPFATGVTTRTVGLAIGSPKLS